MPRVLWMIWLLPVVGMAATVAVYRDAYASEDGRYAGAEPGLAATWAAGPVILLLLAQLVCALGVHTATTPRGRIGWTAGLVTAGAAGVATTVALLAG